MTALDGSGSIIRSEGLRDCSYVLFEDIGFVLCVSPRKDSKPTSKDGKCPVGAQLVVTDCGMFSLFKIGRWISLPAPSPGLLGTTGLGSSLGAGEGRIVLEFLRECKPDYSSIRGTKRKANLPLRQCHWRDYWSRYTCARSWANWSTSSYHPRLLSCPSKECVESCIG